MDSAEGSRLTTSGWDRLHPGQKVRLTGKAGELHTGIIDEQTPDGSIVWLFTALNERKLFHRDEGFQGQHRILRRQQQRQHTGPAGHDPVVTPGLLPVDHRSPVPLYHQVAERIRTAVQSNVLQEGRIIGPERQLAHNFRVSLPTVRRALEILTSEGIIVRKRGLGTLVAGKVRHRPLGVVRQNEPDTDHSRCSVLSVQKTAAGGMVTERLHLTDGDEVWRVVRVEKLHDLPTAILEDYLCGEPTPQDHARLKEAGADATFVSAQGKARMARHEITALGANNWLAQTLCVAPETPLIVLERTVFDAAGKPVEFNRNSYLATHYKFQATFSPTGI